MVANFKEFGQKIYKIKKKFKNHQFKAKIYI